MEVDAACPLPRRSPHDAHLFMDNWLHPVLSSSYVAITGPKAQPHLALVQGVACLDHRVGAVIREPTFHI